jgi:hypothetical protein
MKIDSRVKLVITVALIIATVGCLVYGSNIHLCAKLTLVGLISISQSVNGCGQGFDYKCVVHCGKTTSRDEIELCTKEDCNGCLVYRDNSDKCEISKYVVSTVEQIFSLQNGWSDKNRMCGKRNKWEIV